MIYMEQHCYDSLCSISRVDAALFGNLLEEIGVQPHKGT
jgi:hypothetical protein